MTIARTVRNALEAAGVDHELTAHPHSETSRETAAASHVPDDYLAKAVVLRHDAGYVLAVVPADHHVRLHTLEKFSRGIAFVCLGMAKKILLANPCGKIADMAFNAESVGCIDAWCTV